MFACVFLVWILVITIAVQSANRKESKCLRKEKSTKDSRKSLNKVE